MEKLLAYISHAECCQMMALGARSDKTKAEYVHLAALWLDLAERRRRALSGSAQETPNGP